MSKDAFLLEFRALLAKYNAQLSCPLANDIDDIIVYSDDWDISVSLYDETHRPKQVEVSD